MSRKRQYEDKDEPDIFSFMYNDENSKLNKFQDKLRKEAEELDNILNSAWEDYDKRKAKKLKKEIREVLKDITNLTLNTENIKMSQKIKKRKSKNKK